MSIDKREVTPPSADSWCHIQETITMLYLAVCQIETSMADSGKSVNTLTDAFTELAKHSQTVDQQVQALKPGDELGDFKDEVSYTAREMNERIKQAVTAFQFYDRITQRLDHVARSLERVTTVMQDNNQLNNPESWKTIQTQVKSSYTMEAERIMFEHIMRGATVEEALQIYRHHFEKEEESGSENNDEIELF
ncbi:hypothetical protein R50073_22690 [Maricurvus nonylphenolicus]|uniref:hypothetical protein n=1 Tax=Maricurvus nonylphenolicus TaxID=1008307 RepID=UPI0036F3A53A